MAGLRRCYGCLKAALGPAEVIDGIGAGAAQVTDGFVHAVGNVDRNEIIGTKIFGKLGGIAFVRFDSIAGLGGDQRRGDHVAVHAHLEKASRDPKPTAAGFVAHVEVGELALLAFGDAAHSALQGVNGSGDGPVMPRFGVAVGFEDGDDSFCFMDVKSQVQCLWCV